MRKYKLTTSLPSWERGLKSFEDMGDDKINSSLPSWERGLKYGRLDNLNDYITSLPSWERGLKSGNLQMELRRESRSLRGSVD